MRRNLKNERRGAIVVLSALLMAALVGMVAYAIDHGYLLKLQTDLQKAADAAALAGVQDLIRQADGTQDVAAAKQTVINYVRNNLGEEGFQVALDDIQIGRYDPGSIYSGLQLLNDGTFDTVRVTLRRDGALNPQAPLFFARVFGHDEVALFATGTAVLQKAQGMEPGAEILPFATPQELWNSLQPGDLWSAYGDGKIRDGDGVEVPGNWGTVDVGYTGNSSSDLNDQILDGLRQGDLDALESDGRISHNEYLDSAEPAWMQGDTGLSSGLKQSVQLVHGSKKLIPIYDQLANPNGSHVDFHVIGWGVVTVIDSQWSGNTNTSVTLKKSHWMNGKLRPKGTLGWGDAVIEGAYTSPVLVE